MSKRELIIIDWNKKKIYHNNVLFTRLSYILSEKLAAYDIQDFRIYNAEYDGKPLDEPLFIELNSDSSHLDMLEKQLEWLKGIPYERRIGKQITILTAYLAKSKKEGV